MTRRTCLASIHQSSTICFALAIACIKLLAHLLSARLFRFTPGELLGLVDFKRKARPTSKIIDILYDCGGYSAQVSFPFLFHHSLSFSRKFTEHLCLMNRSDDFLLAGLYAHREVVTRTCCFLYLFHLRVPHHHQTSFCLLKKNLFEETLFRQGLLVFC